MSVSYLVNITQLPVHLLRRGLPLTLDQLTRAAAVLAVAALMAAAYPGVFPANARAEAAPAVTISGPTYTIGNHPFAVDISFSESVTGFEQGDVTVGNASVMAFTGSGASYSITMRPSASGAVTVDVAAGAAKDAGGNPNTAASQSSVQANLNAPAITSPGDKTYRQGQEITAFGITVTDADGDGVSVVVSGLPSGLSYGSSSSGVAQVSGTVSASAAAQDYTVTISADDGVNAAVTTTFTITVTASNQPANQPPVIGQVDGDVVVSSRQYETIEPFSLPVSDPDGNGPDRRKWMDALGPGNRQQIFRRCPGGQSY